MQSLADRFFLAVMGQEWIVVKHQLQAIASNLLSWFLVLVRVRRPALRMPSHGMPQSSARAVQILSPGGFERFTLANLDDADSQGRVLATVGYNVRTGVDRVPGCASLVRLSLSTGVGLPDDCALVRTHAFSVNYADVTIRWGLYESAIRYVGYPIVPGFDFSGTVEMAGKRCRVRRGDRVSGVTFFGAYSERLLVPDRQLRASPPSLSALEAAALPSVAGTALHALALAGFWPRQPLTRPRAVLVHSAAGGVGSMLVQMARQLGCEPIVAVVGAPHKAETCRSLGAHVVIDKSTQDLWAAAREAAPAGFAAVFDANGVATLADSYAHLTRTGTLVCYGFHSNLPSSAMLNPLAWARMAFSLARMPKFDALDLVLNSRTIAGFNLSFFADELELVDAYMEQIHTWVREGKLQIARVTQFDLSELPRAHDLIQSGQSVGKIVCTTASAS